MLQNAYLVAKIGADTAENEQHSVAILPTDARGGPGHGDQLPGRPCYSVLTAQLPAALSPHSDSAPGGEVE